MIAKNSSLPWITCHSASMPEVAEQRDMRREQLGDPAAVRGRVHVEHTLAAQRRRQLADPFERSRLDGAFVVVEMLVEQRHAFEQWIS